MKCSEVIKKLKHAGWYEVRQKGSHLIMKHDFLESTLVVPNHGSKEMGTGLQKELFKQAGIK